MEKTQLLKEWSCLLNPKDMRQQLESYKMIADVAMQIIYKENRTPNDVADRDGNNLFQMTSLKCLSVIRLAEQKLNYVNDITKFKMTVYDSFGLEPIVRAQFEAFGHFNNLYLQNTSKDEKKLKYDLWVMCGLMNRQKFNAAQDETLAKKEAEKKQIENLKNSILNNACYKSLNPKAQQRIFDKADLSDWKLTIAGDNSVFVGWQQLTENAGANEHLKHMYRRFSLNAHPSNVSVFQFRDAYEKGKEEADFFTKMSVTLSKFYISFFIADYCKHSPEAKDVFDKLPELHQLLINSINKMYRGEQYQINDIWKKYENVSVAEVINQKS